MSSIRIEEASEDDREAWDGYVHSHGSASLYHLYGWRNLIERVFDQQCHYYRALDDQGRLVGVLPVTRLRSRLFGDYMVSLPYFNYGGAIGDNGESESALMRHAVSVARDLRLSHLEFRDSVPRDEGWPVRTEKVAMELALPEDSDALWKGIGSKLRAQIRRPSREGAVAVCGGAELADEFYTVFSRNMRDLGTPVYSRALFQAILAAYPEQCDLVVVRLNGKPVAGAFLLRFRGRMEIPWASSVREYNRLGVNMLLYWEVLQRAIERQCTVFDFGRSTRDSGTYRFKKQWGALPRPLYWHYWLREGNELPSLNPDNPKYRTAIRLWQRLPLPVANWLGPMLVRSLP